MHNFTLFSTEENSTEIDNILDNLPKKVRNFFEIEGYYISKPRKQDTTKVVEKYCEELD